MPALDDKVDAASPAARAPDVTYLGVSISMLDAAQAAQVIAGRPAEAPFTYVVTPNAAHFTRLIRLGDLRFKDAYDHAWMRLLDGQVPRALARLLFGLNIPHAAGSDVVDLLLKHFVRPEDRVTVIGGSEEMRVRLASQFGLANVAMHIPPMGFIRDEAAVEACLAFIEANPARYVFFVAGTPQCEYLARMVQLRGASVGCGMSVGGALNFSVGLIPRAPLAFRRAGLEGVYRLMLNPVGHARRVFVDSFPIFTMALQARMKPEAFGMGDRRKDGRS